jgi:hypothetical protein
MVIRKKVEGRVDHNDGEFAEVQTIGIEGIEKDLWLGTFQIHREDTRDTPDEFQRRFPVGKWLDILTTTDITALAAEFSSQNDGYGEDGKRQGSLFSSASTCGRSSPR